MSLLVVAVASACGAQTVDGQPTTAPLSRDDIKFLAGLHSASLMGSQEKQIQAGHNVCYELRKNGAYSTMQWLTGDIGWSEAVATELIFASESAYCPDQLAH